MVFRYEAEQFARREAEDQLQQLKQKHDFVTQVSGREKDDLKDRLNRAQQTIIGLETKVIHVVPIKCRHS